MINLKNISNEEPYKLFLKKYNDATTAGETNPEAIVISSYNKEDNEVDSRMVNLKAINGKELIFFSNYNSPKSFAFKSHDQISGLFYWPSINVQVRIKAMIRKTSLEFNQKYFKERSLEKNALAISSRQSEQISSYSKVIKNYDEVYKRSDLHICPDYWGGFSFTPYYFEFWEGHEFRINKRLVFLKKVEKWKKFIIQP